ncbi:hypothetical protein AA303_07395 [Pseudomonas psychrophila]|nr:hypothetical protein AA303_07395 [Pseudomonas psychrophila]
MSDELSGCSGIGTAHKAELMKLTWLDRPRQRRQRGFKKLVVDASCHPGILVYAALPRFTLFM